MAINVQSLGTYVEEKKLPLLRKAVIGSKSASLFNLQTGIKGATKLNLLETNVAFGDGTACGWNEAGESKLSQRMLTPGAIKVNMSFCDKKLLKTWMNYEVRVAAGQKTLPFEEDFTNGVVEDVNAKLEKAIWQGDTASSDANLNKFDDFDPLSLIIDEFDGVIKIADAATLAKVVTYAAGDSASDVVKEVYAAIPSAAFTRGEVKMYMGADMYRGYIQELIANGNLVITTGVQDVAMPDSILVPGTNVRVEGVAGLDGTGRVFASYADNFVYGVDLEGDEEKLEMWYSQDNREHRLAIEFIAGTQIAYPDMVVTAKKQ